MPIESLVSATHVILHLPSPRLQVLALEWKPWTYFNDSWNRFDLLIVANGWLEGAGVSFDGLTILRLLRLLRVFRLVKTLPRLRSIVESLIQGFASVVWIMVLMAIFNYIMGCLGMLLFKDIDPFHYGTVLSALFATYMCETLDGWEVMIRVNTYGCANYDGGYPEMQGESTTKYQCNPDVRSRGGGANTAVLVSGGEGFVLRSLSLSAAKPTDCP